MANSEAQAELLSMAEPGSLMLTPNATKHNVVHPTDTLESSRS